MPHALITIGITSYNALDTLDAAIGSALQQDWKNFEIIVCDDCSNDGSWKHLCDNYSSDKRLKLIHNEKNLGVAATRNKIIDAARGEYITFFDDDDVSQPHRLRAQYLALQQAETIQPDKDFICYSARLQKYPDGHQRIEYPPGLTMPYPGGKEMALRILTGKPLENGFGSMATCSQMARTIIFKKLGGFDTDLRRSEDTDFNIRASVDNIFFVGLKEPLVQQQMSYGEDKTLEAEEIFFINLINKHSQIIDNISEYNFSTLWINGKYLYLRNKKIAFLKHMLCLCVRYPAKFFQRLFWTLPNISYNRRLKKFMANH